MSDTRQLTPVKAARVRVSRKTDRVRVSRETQEN
ncbi:hypothetical protein SacmaDRAFT_0705 [Saccharomonospora marina XMU15]|uniref:Uncharacterized protein n=1 Tax=Saccharomonospora marina XMU15 TaxID=882083 RepID=H5X6B6_9PSEU|nr:hypothetical protein SacmaDRAFT_0705 [Saccharomonospora marina XMU15]